MVPRHLFIHTLLVSFLFVLSVHNGQVSDSVNQYGSQSNLKQIPSGPNQFCDQGRNNSLQKAKHLRIRLYQWLYAPFAKVMKFFGWLFRVKTSQNSEDPISRMPEEKRWMLDTLRSQVNNIPGLENRARKVEHELDDAMLARFIEGAYWNLEHKGIPIIQHIESTILWRESYCPHNLNPSTLGITIKNRSIQIDGPLKSALTDGAVIVHGTDKLGRPVVYANLGMLFCPNRTVEECLKLTLYAVERAWKNKSYGIHAYTIVVNCKGFGIRHLPPLNFLRRSFAILRRHYPMRLSHIILINVSASAKIGWKVASPVIPPRTKDKVIFTTEKDRDIVEKYIARHELLKSLGGTSTYEYDPLEYFKSLH